MCSRVPREPVIILLNVFAPNSAGRIYRARSRLCRLLIPALCDPLLWPRNLPMRNYDR